MSYESIVLGLQYSSRKPSERDWDVADEEGWTVAHFWVQHHCMPHDFPYWQLADKDGWSVAHTAAIQGKLPADFKLWDIADKNGNSVAHVVAKKVGWFKSWDKAVLSLTNNEGVRVWDLIREKNHEQIERLKKELIKD